MEQNAIANSLSVKHELDAGPDSQPKPKLTPYVVFAALLTGTGGLVYGYDLSVAGGVLVMEDFMMKFYPEVYKEKQSAKQDNYCKYNSQVLQLYPSTFCLAALISTFVAARITRIHGHCRTMIIAGLFYIVGTVLGAGAQNLAMLILGRVMLGFGAGLSEQAIPLYLAEIAPPNGRGMLLMIHSITISLGVTLSNIVNFASSYIKGWGWRLSLGITIFPSMTILLAGLTLVDTPTFLIYKKKHDEAKTVLSKIRGSSDNQFELSMLNDFSHYHDINASNSPMQSLQKLFQLKYTPQLVMAIAFPIFQQFTGNDLIGLYGPFLFKIGGLDTHSSLYSNLIVHALVLVSILISMFIVDRVGRKIILLVCSTIMFLTMIMIGVIFATEITSKASNLTTIGRVTELMALCVNQAAFAASWGPFTKLIPSEIFPQDIRSIAQSISVFTNMLFKFMMAQTLLSMLCAFKYGIFLFFAGWVFIMIIFTQFLLPETKGIPMDKMVDVWKSHWFWGWFSKQKDKLTINTY